MTPTHLNFQPDIIECIYKLGQLNEKKMNKLQGLYKIFEKRIELENYYSSQLEEISHDLVKLKNQDDQMNDIINGFISLNGVQSEQSKIFSEAIQNDVMSDFQGFNQKCNDFYRKLQLEEIGRRYYIALPKYMEYFQMIRANYYSIYNNWYKKKNEISQIRNLQYDVTNIFERIEKYDPNNNLKSITKEARVNQVNNNKTLISTIQLENYKKLIQNTIEKKVDIDFQDIQTEQQLQQQSELQFTQQNENQIQYLQLFQNLATVFLQETQIKDKNNLSNNTNNIDLNQIINQASQDVLKSKNIIIGFINYFENFFQKKLGETSQQNEKIEICESRLNAQSQFWGKVLDQLDKKENFQQIQQILKFSANIFNIRNQKTKDVLNSIEENYEISLLDLIEKHPCFNQQNEINDFIDTLNSSKNISSGEITHIQENLHIAPIQNIGFSETNINNNIDLLDFDQFEEQEEKKEQDTTQQNQNIDGQERKKCISDNLFEDFNNIQFQGQNIQNNNKLQQFEQFSKNQNNNQNGFELI